MHPSSGAHPRAETPGARPEATAESGTQWSPSTGSEGVNRRRHGTRSDKDACRLETRTPRRSRPTGRPSAFGFGVLLLVLAVYLRTVTALLVGVLLAPRTWKPRRAAQPRRPHHHDRVVTSTPDRPAPVINWRRTGPDLEARTSRVGAGAREVFGQLRAAVASQQLNVSTQWRADYERRCRPDGKGLEDVRPIPRGSLSRPDLPSCQVR
jgi:hypothetical protein